MSTDALHIHWIYFYSVLVAIFNCTQCSLFWLCSFLCLHVFSGVLIHTLYSCILLYESVKTRNYLMDMVDDKEDIARISYLQLPVNFLFIFLYIFQIKSVFLTHHCHLFLNVCMIYCNIECLMSHGKVSAQYGRDGVSNHQPHNCLLNRLFRRISKKTSKLRVTGLCAGNSPVTGEFPAQRASNAENVSIWWRHHKTNFCPECLCSPSLTETRCDDIIGYRYSPVRKHAIRK